MLDNAMYSVSSMDVAEGSAFEFAHLLMTKLVLLREALLQLRIQNKNSALVP